MERLHLAATAPAVDEHELQSLAALPRPWDPATCRGLLRSDLWAWLDDVAHWMNSEHLWGLSGAGIPGCWPAHPHVVHDLAVIASSRYLASYAVTPASLEEWHRYALPAFHARLAERLGDGCLAEHQTSPPRHGRDTDFTSGPLVGLRARWLQADATAAREIDEASGSRL